MLGVWVLISPWGAEFLGSDDSDMGSRRHRANRRRAGRPEAVVHASAATAAGRRPTIRMRDEDAVVTRPASRSFCDATGSGPHMTPALGN
ncbi:hypothetical protein [Bradyrhizobium sp. CSA112]|uniref:hypothetical protein n=1 Tax=Bradyrhizobium sp. CSA112 TaxID=2699170 RepID=UPI0023AF1A50|nr:hypothetical protein [Bradyrhizobium sp. CSA112]